MNRVILLATLMALSLVALVEGERNIFKEGLSEVNAAINDASKELKGILGSGEKAKEKEKAPVAPAPSAATETRPKRGLLRARLFPRSALGQAVAQMEAATAALTEPLGNKMDHPEKETRPEKRLFTRAAVGQVTGPAGAVGLVKEQVAAVINLDAVAGHEHHDAMGCNMNHPEKETRPEKRLFTRAAAGQVNEPVGAKPELGLVGQVQRNVAAAENYFRDVIRESQDHIERQTRPKREATIGAEQTASQNPFGSLANFGSQIEGAKMFGSIFGSTPSSTNPSTSEIVGSLTSMVRSSQESGNKLASETQQNALQAQQVGTNAAQETQKGFVSALAEIGRGLKQISQNNPSLVPDVKNLFSSVSSKLNTSPFAGLAEQAKQQSSSIIPATNPQQLSDNLAKVSLPGLQTPA